MSIWPAEMVRFSAATASLDGVKGQSGSLHLVEVHIDLDLAIQSAGDIGTGDLLQGLDLILQLFGQFFELDQSDIPGQVDEQDRDLGEIDAARSEVPGKGLRAIRSGRRPRPA